MKRTVAILFVFMLLLVGTSAFAEEKIAFINMKDILLLSDQGKEASAEFQEVFLKKRENIQNREAELKKMKEELEKQRLVLTETAMREKELEYEKEFRDYKRLVEDSNAEIQRMDQELSRKMIPEILKVVDEIGKRDGYTMILDIGMAGIAYHSPARDISKQVIQEFNKAYKSKKK
jgi:outer membrane protein